MDVLPDFSIVRTVGQTTYLRRPGKTYGISASINHKGNDRLMMVFSTSTEFETSPSSYDKFGAYTARDHNSDFSAAAKELSRRGYGSRAEPPLPPEPPKDDEKHDAFSDDHWCDWRSAYLQILTFTRETLRNPNLDATDKCLILAAELPREAAAPASPDDGFDPDDETDSYTTYKVMSRRTALSPDTCARHFKELALVPGSPYTLPKLPGMGKPRPDPSTGEMVPTTLTILQCAGTAREDLKFFAKCQRPPTRKAPHGGSHKPKPKQVALAPPAARSGLSGASSRRSNPRSMGNREVFTARRHPVVADAVVRHVPCGRHGRKARCGYRRT